MLWTVEPIFTMTKRWSPHHNPPNTSPQSSPRNAPNPLNTSQNIPTLHNDSPACERGNSPQINERLSFPNDDSSFFPNISSNVNGTISNYNTSNNFNLSFSPQNKEGKSSNFNSKSHLTGQSASPKFPSELHPLNFTSGLNLKSSLCDLGLYLSSGLQTLPGLNFGLKKAVSGLNFGLALLSLAFLFVLSPAPCAAFETMDLITDLRANMFVTPGELSYPCQNNAIININ